MEARVAHRTIEAGVATFEQQDGGVALSLRNLAVRFGHHEVLWDVDLDLFRGEMLGLIGRNGCGKTTIVRAVTRLVSRSSGSVVVCGEPVDRLNPAALARRIAVVPQAAEPPDGFTGLEVVLMGRTPYLPLLGSEGAEDLRIARQAMEQTDTWAFADRRVDRLSGGERQRLMLARALAQQTPVLLLDEPTAHLDIGHQAELFDLLAVLRRANGLSVLAVVHDLTLAAHYCDRLALLDGGRIVASGTPAAVLTETRVSAAFGAQVVIASHPETGRPVVLYGSRPALG